MLSILADDFSMDVPYMKVLPSKSEEIKEAAFGRLHKGGAAAFGGAPLCGFPYLGLSMGTGSCFWNALPAMCRFAYGFPHGSEH